jgi:hypothetical protein
LIKVFLFGLWCPLMSKTNHQHINERSIRHSKCILMILWKPFWMTSLILVIWLITYKSFSIILEPTKIMISIWTLRNVLWWFLLVDTWFHYFKGKKASWFKENSSPCQYACTKQSTSYQRF